MAVIKPVDTYIIDFKIGIVAAISHRATPEFSSLFLLVYDSKLPSN